MSTVSSSRRRRVFVHVGSPKTGTTYLQDVLWSQRDLAARQGLRLPLDRFFDHFLATLDVRGLSDRPGQPPEATGAWSRLVEAACSGRGDALISHELFAGAHPEQAAAAIAQFPDDVEVHLVLTARDLARQIPAEWQEHVKHRYTKSLRRFTRRLRRDTDGASWFWRVQDYGRLLETWRASVVPVERVHVVTVPPRGADPGLLWQRFAGLLGLDPASFDASRATGNSSLGFEQVEVLRRVNRRLSEDIAIPGAYPRVVKEIYAQQILAARSGTPLVLDDDTYGFARMRSEEQVATLASCGYDVVGDLADLVPAARDRATPGKPTTEQLLEESLAATAELIERLAQRGPAEARYREVLREAERTPVRFVVREFCERHSSVDRARHAYHRVRRLTSPSASHEAREAVARDDAAEVDDGQR